MGNMPTLRLCVRAIALLTLLASTLFVGAERPVIFRMILVLCAFMLVFPADYFIRLAHLATDKRPEPKDFLFASALDPSEGHVEPIEYTLIGVITEVRDLNNTNDSPS